jgi:hypothetical protein
MLAGIAEVITRDVDDAEPNSPTPEVIRLGREATSADRFDSEGIGRGVPLRAARTFPFLRGVLLRLTTERLDAVIVDIVSASGQRT